MVDKSVEIYIIFADEDKVLADELITWLIPLQNSSLIHITSKNEFMPGESWMQRAEQFISESQIILFLISPNFFSSKYCSELEMPMALTRHANGESLVIPILLRFVDSPTIFLSHLQVLPRNAKPIVDWHDRNSAFLDIVEGIKQAVHEVKSLPHSIGQIMNSDEMKSAISDAPKIDSKDDKLEFRPYIDALYNFITSPETTTPLVISINGAWGTGKSSMMGMLKRRLEPHKGYYWDMYWQGLAWRVGQFGRKKLESSQKAYQEIIEQRVKQLWLSRWLLKWARVEDGKRMERILESIVKREPMELLYYPTVWFNAWKFTQEEQLWAALASEIINQLNDRQYALFTRLQFWFQLRRSRANLLSALGPVLLNLLLIVFLSLITVLYPSLIYPFIVSHLLPFFRGQLPIQNNAGRAASTTATVGGFALALATIQQIVQAARKIVKTHPFHIPINTIINNPNYQEKMGYISQFSEDFRRIVSVATRHSSKAWTTQKLVIFIDDLDRCRPLQAVGVIEAINLFLDSEQCVFVLGIDADAVAASIEAKYKELAEKVHHDKPDVVSYGRAFLEKIIQISLTIPHADDTHIERLIVSLTQQIESTSKTNATLVTSYPTLSSIVEDASLSVQPGEAAEVVLAAQREVRVYFQNEDVQRAVKEASKFLQRNPRRIKQFINLFRLKMFLINQDKKRRKYFERQEDNEENFRDFVLMLAWSIQWSEIARLVIYSSHGAEVCDFLLTLCEKLKPNAEQFFNQPKQTNTYAERSSVPPSSNSKQSTFQLDWINAAHYDPTTFNAILDNLVERRDKVKSFPAHWSYLPWEEWLYDKNFRFCTLHFRNHWQLGKDGDLSVLLELVRS